MNPLVKFYFTLLAKKYVLFQQLSFHLCVSSVPCSNPSELPTLLKLSFLNWAYWAAMVLGFAGHMV